MKKIIASVLILSALVYFNWAPSTSSIVNKMTFENTISYEGVEYHSDWGETDTIEGYIRRIDRHYDKNVPIITYDIPIATQDYSDPNIVKIKHHGGGNYYWSAKVQPKGTLVFYHTVPSNALSQDKLDSLKDGLPVRIVGRISKNSEIKSDGRTLWKLGHSNHKLILVEDVIQE